MASKRKTAAARKRKLKQTGPRPPSGSSRYAKKVAARRKGVDNPRSPFRTVESVFTPKNPVAAPNYSDAQVAAILNAFESFDR